MLTITIKNKRIKLLNWFIFIFVIIFIIYIIGSLIFLLPIFNKTYNYKSNMKNYSMVSNTTFKNTLLNCSVKEQIFIKTNDKTILGVIENDLLNDGYKKNNKSYVRKYKKVGFCKNERKEYEKNHGKGYITFKLNGKANEYLLYEEDYKDSYVTAIVDNKEFKGVDINTNFNKNKIGKYVMSYTLNISSSYKQRLYRTINVIDKQKPIIKLNGDKNVVLNFGASYKEPGFTSEDNYDGDITNKVVIKNTVNSKVAGTYKITYKVKDSSGNKTNEYRMVTVMEKETSVNKESPNIKLKDGITYINGILLVNKTYSLPKNYDPKVNKTALKALKQMQSDAKVLGLDLSLISGYRSYKTQEKLYKKYVNKDGESLANTYSAKPGHSEHQTGLAFDIGSVDRSFANTSEAKWIEENAYLYGFIVRYPKDKTNITGYIYEPWHVRYLGKDIAKKIWESGLTLEEYLGVY